MTQAATLRDDKSVTTKPSLVVKLASPRGFCAGVERAIETVEKALAKYGAPVFVRHEIVHNRHVVDRLAAMGAIFIEDLSEANPSRPIVFSAHGAPRAAHDDADARNLLKIDATCPLVLKVHNQTRRYAAQGKHIYIIGHANHPEIIGTIGQAPDGVTTLVETVDDVAKLPPLTGPKAYVTQTTLSVDDARAIVNALKNRFPEITGPNKEDICYATTNRQEAVKYIAPDVDLFVIIGSKTSSNSKRLVDVAIAAGSNQAVLIDDAQSFDFDMIDNVQIMGLSAGASAPESLVENFLACLAQRCQLMIETVETAREDIAFKLPMRLAG